MYDIIFILVFLLGVACNADSTENNWKNQGFYRPRRNYPQSQTQNPYSQSTQPFEYSQTAQRQNFGSSYNQYQDRQNNAFDTQKVQNAFGAGFNSFRPQNTLKTGYNQANLNTFLNQKQQNQNFAYNSNSQPQNAFGSTIGQNYFKNQFSDYNQQVQSKNSFGTNSGQNQRQPFGSGFGQNAFQYQNVATSSFGQNAFKGPEYLPAREPTRPPYTAPTYLPPREIPRTTTKIPFFTTTRRPYTTTYRPFYTTTQRPLRKTTRRQYFNTTTQKPTTRKLFYSTTAKIPFSTSTTTFRGPQYIPPKVGREKPRPVVAPAMAMRVPLEPEDDQRLDQAPAMAIPVPLEPEDDPTPTTPTTTSTTTTTTTSTTSSTPDPNRFLEEILPIKAITPTTTPITTPSTTTTTTTTTPSTTTFRGPQYIPPKVGREKPRPVVAPAMAMRVPLEPEDDQRLDQAPAMAIPVPLEPEDDPTPTTPTTTSTTTTTTTSTTSSTPDPNRFLEEILPIKAITPTTTPITTPSTTTTTTTTTPSTTTFRGPQYIPPKVGREKPRPVVAPAMAMRVPLEPEDDQRLDQAPAMAIPVPLEPEDDPTPTTPTTTSTTTTTTTSTTSSTPDPNRFLEEILPIKAITPTTTPITTPSTTTTTTTTTPSTTTFRGPQYIPPKVGREKPRPVVLPAMAMRVPLEPEDDQRLDQAPAMAIPVPLEPEDDPTPTTPTTTSTTTTTTTSTTSSTPDPNRFLEEILPIEAITPTTTPITTPSTTTTTTTTTPSTTTFRGPQYLPPEVRRENPRPPAAPAMAMPVPPEPEDEPTTTPITTPSTTTVKTLTIVREYPRPAPARAMPVPPEPEDDPTAAPTTPTTTTTTTTTTEPEDDPTTPNEDRFLIEEIMTTPPPFEGPLYLPPVSSNSREIEVSACLPPARNRRADRSAKTLRLGDVKGARPVWHVGVYIKTTVPFMQICGGSVVRQDVVISAAHCFWSDLGPDSADNYAVGANKIYKPYGEPMDKRAQKSDVKEIILPPRYRGSVTSFQDDLAILKLASPFTYSRGLRPVCVNFDDDLDDQQLVEGNSGTIAGWGYTDSEGSRTQWLLWLELPFVAAETCIQRSEGFVKYITSDKICAGEFNTGKALCKGDSGGGLVFWHGQPDSAVPYLRGIASTAPSADNLKCNVLAAGSFTSINAHRRFLRKHVPGIDEDCQYMQ